MSVFQCTIERPVVVEGQGLHSGKSTRTVLRPAGVNQGIFFRVLYKGREKIIPARIPYAAAGCRSSVLQNGEAVVATVEHFLGACWGAGVDNLEVIVDGEELPAGDGSALHWLKALEHAGVKTQGAYRKIFAVGQVFHVGQGASHLFAFPAKSLVLTYVLDCTAKGEFLQGLTFQEGEAKEVILGARTFAFSWEEEELKKNNLGMGVREEAVLLDPLGLGNRSFRSPCEACAHKILDLLGDLMLLGVRVQGGFFGFRSGHALNQEMVRILWEAASNAY